MALVYLDNCAIQRPLDDRDQYRVRIEADAITAVLAAVEQGTVDLLSSAALRIESGRVRNRSRKEFAAAALGLANRVIPATSDVRTLAVRYQSVGIRSMDALHLASAVLAGADYFCTTDDRLLRRSASVDTQNTRVVDPLVLAEALSL
ncbi:MAG: PIN domain-containing protein [Bacteroidota bacterium]